MAQPFSKICVVIVFAGVNMDEDLPIDIHCNKLLGMIGCSAVQW